MKKLLNRIFDKLSPYIPGEQPKNGNFIKLNTNENPFPPSAEVLNEIRKSIKGSLRKYPDPQAKELRKVIGVRYKFSPEWIFAGNGSDEILRLCIVAFSNFNERIVFPYPSYPLYDTLSVISDRRPEKIALKNDFTISESFIDKYRDCMKIIANPDSPSGTFHPVEIVEQIVRKNNRVVVIDEAYVDFARDSCISLVRKYDNVIVTRSFSKSFSLAGIRLGYCFGNPDLISALFSIKDSYNVNSISQAAGIAAMKNYDYFMKNCKKVMENREYLRIQLEKLNFSVFPSSGNFLLVSPPDNNAAALYQHLKRRKILVRYFDGISELEHYIRITVGSLNEITILIGNIKNFYGY